MSDDGFDLGAEFAAFGEDLLGKVFPNGPYTLKIKKATCGKSGTGKFNIKLVHTIVGGPFDGKTVTDTLTWSPESDQAAQIFARTVQKMGAPVAWIKGEEPGQVGRPTGRQIEERLTGTVIEATMKEDTWNGEKRNKIAYGKTLQTGGGGVGSVSVAEGDVEDLDVSDAEPIDGAESLPEQEIKAKVTTPPAAKADDVDWI